jgi:hypothetical protein
MLSMPSRDKEEPFTDSVSDEILYLELNYLKLIILITSNFQYLSGFYFRIFILFVNSHVST